MRAPFARAEPLEAAPYLLSPARGDTKVPRSFEGNHPMKTIWIQAIPWDKDLVTAALEAGADGVLVEEGRSPDVRALGLITTIAPDGDLQIGREVVEVVIKDKADEQRALELSR